MYGELILNQYTSYNVIEELETELTYSSINQSGLCTLGVLLLLKLPTGVELDKYDRFVETSNGKDTLRDTIEILFQNASKEGTYETNFQYLSSPFIQDTYGANK